jgi:NADPH:quinone reductase-like Zn-dependent oxidoreductase
VRIHAASVNPVDFKIREGKLKPVLRYRLPFVLGSDLAGEVVRVGTRVHDFKPGDLVYGRADKMRIGSFAQFIAISEDDIALKPSSLDMVSAAAIPLAGLTAWQAFTDQYKLRRGQRVLIHAGSGGVGTLAIQLAKHLGAFVATTTSTGNVGWVKSLGADEVIDYRKQDFARELSGYDLVLDTLGGEALEKSFDVLKPGGTIISISGPPDPAFAQEIGANPVVSLAMRFLSRKVRKLAARRRMHYSFFFMRPSGKQLRKLAALVDAHELRPVVDRVFAFAETKAALDYVEAGHAKGKVVIRMV